MLDIAKIRIDGDTQARESLNEAVVAEYADAYRSGAQMPPVTVFYDGSAWWLADGFHRYHGAKAAGLTAIYEEITPGTRRDAQRYSLGANGRHGLRRTNADKRAAVEMALRDPEWAQLSDRKLADLCAVSVPFVGAVRRPQVAEQQDANRVEHAKVIAARCNPLTPAPTTSTTTASAVNHALAHAGRGSSATDTVAASRPGLAPPAPPATPAGEPPLPPPAPAGAPSPAPQADNAAPEEYAPSEEEIAAAQAAAEADAEALQRLLQSDEPLGDALRTVRQLRAELAAVKSTRDGYMTQCNEQISRIKSLQRQVDKLKKELEAAHGPV